MASAKRSRWLKVVIVASVGCLILLVLPFLYLRWSFTWPFRPWKGEIRLDPALYEVSWFAPEFALAYARHVSRDEWPDLPLEGWYAAHDITRSYAPDAVRPNLEQTRGSLHLLSPEEAREGKLPFRDLVIEANLEDVLSGPLFSEEAGVFRRVSGPGENAAFACMGEEDTPLYVLRHNPALARGVALMTFRLEGLDPESGTVRRQLHMVRFVENPAAARNENQPPFLITSHTIEELPAGEAE